MTDDPTPIEPRRPAREAADSRRAPTIGRCEKCGSAPLELTVEEFADGSVLRVCVICAGGPDA